MNRLKQSVFLIPVLAVSSCASLKDSMILGGAVGAASVAVPMAISQSTYNHKVDAGQVATSAAVGLGIGLLTSYIIHKTVEREVRPYSTSETPEMHFGDLPPSPFVMPPVQIEKTKKGTK